jgi:hypothetical protein
MAIRPKFLIHVTTVEPKPLVYTLEALNHTIEPQLHLLTRDGHHTRCGRHRSEVERVWPYSVWTQTIEGYHDHCGACWFNTQRIIDAAMRVRG